jgi:hypothetical protein
MGERQIGVSLVIYMATFGWICWSKPPWLFRPDGSIRPFGVGYRDKTILPLWLVAILLGIIVYTVVAAIYKSIR